MAAAGPILASFEDAFPGYATADISQVECSKALATHPDPRLYINAKHIVSSPYQNLTNQLNLQSLGKPHRLFALALMVLSPIRADFRSAPYMSIFNWPDLFHLLRALCMQNGVKWRRQEFYVVIFRSKLRQGIDRDRLGELDQRSHEEACASGGLLKYWFGVSDEDHRNLATCIWRNRDDARAGGSGPWHHQARNAAREMYETITFHTHTLVVETDVASWQLDDYHE